jgi:hypothetical protein
MVSGSYDEFRIYDYALTHNEVVYNLIEGPGGGGPGGPEFRRGDPNDDGIINITDGIYILNFLFLGGETPPCMEAANPNDDTVVNITDGIYVLNFLFLGGPDRLPPGVNCGEEPGDSPSNMGCDSYTNC